MVSSEDFLLGLTGCHFLAVSLCDRESESRLSSVSPYKDTIIMRAPLSWPLLNQLPRIGPSFSEDHHIRPGFCRAIFSLPCTFSVSNAVLLGGRKSHCTVAYISDQFSLWTSWSDIDAPLVWAVGKKKKNPKVLGSSEEIWDSKTTRVTPSLVVLQGKWFHLRQWSPVVKNTPEFRWPEFKCLLCHFQAVWTWALIFPSLKWG